MASALEAELHDRGLRYLAGIDEAGRGPLAGPVLAVAVILPPGLVMESVDDSKRTTPRAREAAATEIERSALAVGIGAASPGEIDQLNILRATHLAMERAVRRLTIEPEHLLVDGLPDPAFGERQTAVVGGDA